ncbi:ATP synthase subunit I [Oceanobacillus salinisoli]|uniref:ATP synthase subunit I n=1 Tax=Oceanobacillus salinisoli TaxID=2678611 RepID=UPI0012E18CF5|nr:ATP synthase subunit I [Oceanobacillus salinisoli]
MSDYDSMVNRQRKWMLYLLALLVIGAGFSSYTRVFNGLLLGSAISFYNLWLLQHKTKAFGKAVAESGSTRGALGTFSRLAAVALAVLVAIRFEETFHIIAVVVGIASSYFIIILDIIVQYVTNSRNSKKSNS